MADTVTYRTRGPVALVGLDRPARRNAVDRATAEALSAAFARFDADPALAVAVLSGEGGTFCAGADLQEFAAGRGNRLEPDGDGPMGPTRAHLSKPVIAAIEGHAVAGGLELALWCDLRVAAADAVLGVFCRRHGVPLIDGGTVRLPRLIGRARALDLILTGRAVEAGEALAMGLVDRVVPRGEALGAAIRLGEELSAFPQGALRADRESVYRQEGRTLAEALREEFALGMRAVESGEARAGAAAFTAGRKRPG